ncbi:MAG: OmpA family protein, partial [Solirubrobacterales bacterium]|nr:OmpA family protein [Solirubrobacterales bacterium]
NLQPYIGGRPEEAKGKDGKAAAKQEEEGFKKLKEKVDAIAKEQGLSGRVQTRLTKDGLAIRVLTDDLLFDSGQAVPKPQSLPLLDKVGGLLAAEGKHPVVVEGHTDTVPVHGAYPSNWELSAARASGVVRAFIGAGLSPGRMTASGRAYLKPVADNATAAGRSLNRRVEVLLPRLVAVPAASPSTPSSELPG